MASEVDGLKSKMQPVVQERVSRVEYLCGRLEGAEVVVAQAGIGKVNAAICAQTMCLKFAPDLILNTGVSGGYQMDIGSVVVADAVVEHDMDTSPIGDPKGYISGLNMVKMPATPWVSKRLYLAAQACGAACYHGVIASGDQFINSNQKAQELHDLFGAIAYEMEGAAIGHVCSQNDLPFSVLRVISDNGDDQSHLDYPTFMRQAADRSVAIVREFLCRL